MNRWKKEKRIKYTRTIRTDHSQPVNKMKVKVV